MVWMSSTDVENVSLIPATANLIRQCSMRSDIYYNGTGNFNCLYVHVVSELCVVQLYDFAWSEEHSFFFSFFF